MVQTIKETKFKEILNESISDAIFESKQTPIKTIIFDFGGVIFTDGSWAAVKKLKNALRLQDEDCTILEECFSNEPGAMGQLLRLGLITLDEFLDRFIEKLGLKKSKKKLIKNLWFSSYVPNYNMRKIIKKLSKNYRLVAFSGNVKERIEYLEKRYDILKFFNDRVFTFDHQKNKRDLEIYYELLEHIDCDPSEAVLIDDSWNNINRAKKVGLHAIYFAYTKQFLKDLDKLDIKVEIK